MSLPLRTFDIAFRPRSAAQAPQQVVSHKPPLPTLPSRIDKHSKETEVHLPPLISGSFVAAFAKALAEGLDNALLTHYYLPDGKVKVNVDRVLDRLLADFCREVWDELYKFYHDSDTAPSTQVMRLFEGPISQLILILNGPETSKCVLDLIAPGVSSRKVTWTATASGVDLPMALQLICGFWHREYPDQSPGGCPEQISRTLHSLMLGGQAAKKLVTEIRRLLMSPNYVQMHLAESTIWEIIRRRPFRPPADGFQLIQYKFSCQLFGPLDGIGDPQLVNIGSLPAITGTAGECVYTTVAEYTDKQWSKAGRTLLRCLEEAVMNASSSHQAGEPSLGIAVWDSSDQDGTRCPGLKLIHMEVEDNSIRVSVSAWTHMHTEIFQQMSWTCAALSSSPFPGTLSECAVQVSDWAFQDDSVFVDCSLSHEPISEDHNQPWLTNFRGAAIARGFPLAGFPSLAEQARRAMMH